MGAGVGVASLVFAALAVSAPQAAAQDWSRCLEGSSDTQAVFARAAQASGVPQDVLLAVGYLSSRWSNNDGAPSTSGGVRRHAPDRLRRGSQRRRCEG